LPSRAIDFSSKSGFVLLHHVVWGEYQTNRRKKGGGECIFLEYLKLDSFIWF
jgi:hypothetical protein